MPANAWVQDRLERRSIFWARSGVMSATASLIDSLSKALTGSRTGPSFSSSFYMPIRTACIMTGIKSRSMICLSDAYTVTTVSVF